ncbi:MAG: 5-formyltetrahydrofolate cyclo-ligase [Ruminococcus sp.]|nr:5-formyltetrahydrofolate cyclo-ligase [Ruminococcus sp.]
MQVSAKKELRALLKNERSIIPKDKKAIWDNSIAEKLLQSEYYKACRELLIYVSFDIEVDTIKIISHALGEKQVYCPKCFGDTNIMEFYRITSLDDLKKGKYGILEPDTSSGATNSFSADSLCVVPGLSFDNNGHRLGFGKGFYDRFLSDFAGTAIGICYDSFVKESLPTEEFDKCVDHLITEQRIISFGQGKEE